MKVKEKVIKQPQFTEDKVQTFDPKKNYRWEPTDVFTMTGAEFNMVFNGLLNYINTPEVQAVIRNVKAFEVMQNILVQNIENGKIKEAEPEEEEDDDHPHGLA